ncbi:hypothetical protein ACFE33_08230 [Falsihalocynthiibacter sp. SS001]
MRTLTNGYRGFALLLGLNYDRLLAFGALTVALMTGAFIANALAL